MALTRQKKTDNIEILRKHASEATALFGVGYKGLNTADLTAIRGAFHAEKLGSLVVAKNTLGQVAFKDGPFADSAKGAEGNILYVFAKTEAPLVAKKLVDYSREYESFEPKFALLEDQYYDARGFVAISKLPTREVALSQLLATMQAPVAQLARTLNEIPARLVRVVDAVARNQS